MLELLAKNWWTFTLRGIVAIIFGVLAILWPSITLWALVILFGAYAIVDGVFSIVAGLSGTPRTRPWWVYVLWGVLGIAAGIVAFIWPGITALVLLYVIAFWAIAHGVMEIIAAIQLRKVIADEWLLVLTGALSILFGVILLTRPAVGALAVVWLIGIMAIAIGALMIGVSVRLKGVKDRMTVSAVT